MLKKRFLLLSSTLALTTSVFAGNLQIPTQKWQLLGFNEELDLVKTFKGTPVQVVWIWNNQTGDWETYSPQYAMEVALKNDGNNFVTSLPANQGFWVYSYADTNVTPTAVYYPLFDMCVNVNSDLYWATQVDDSGNTLDAPYPKCDDYLSTLPTLDVYLEKAEIKDNKLTASFHSTLPTVYMQTLETNTSVKLSNITDYSNFIDINGSIETISVKRERENEGEITNIEIALGNSVTTDNYNTLTLNIGVLDNKFVQVAIPVTK